MTLKQVVIHPGKVYILRNPALKDAIVKIGQTKRKSENRAQELFRGTGVAAPFEVLYEEEVADCELAERLIHKQLAEHRVHRDSEFFKVPLKVAVDAVFRTCLRVNKHLLKDNSRLAIYFEKDCSTNSVFDLLRPYFGGNTAIRIIIQRSNVNAEIQLGEDAMIKCTPELLALLHNHASVREISLHTPIEE
jgi:T5orf172 domain